MGRRITTGVALSTSPIPQTIQIENNQIGTTQAGSNLILRGEGAGVVDINTLSSTAATITTTNSTILNVTGLATLNEISEITSSISGATGTVSHNFDNGGIFYHTGISANFTANFTNVPTTNNRGMAMVLILNQGGTGRFPNAVQIDGSAVTIRWANNTVPTPSTNRIDIATFTLFRFGDAWFVTGTYTNFA
jgi:hypothetical protein